MTTEQLHRAPAEEAWRSAVGVLVQAWRDGEDVATTVTRLCTAAAAETGGLERLLSNHPDSWEAAHVAELLRAAGADQPAVLSRHWLDLEQVGGTWRSSADRAAAAAAELIAAQQAADEADDAVRAASARLRALHAARGTDEATYQAVAVASLLAGRARALATDDQELLDAVREWERLDDLATEAYERLREAERQAEEHDAALGAPSAGTVAP